MDPNKIPLLTPKVLLLGGWAGSKPEAHGDGLIQAPPPGHASRTNNWMSRWENLHGDEIVDQDDWHKADKEEWIARLEEHIASQDGPIILVAHSLGCLLTASWAARSPHASKVLGALLVAPGDPDRDGVRTKLATWIPIEGRRLPFPSILVASRNDRFCSFSRAQGFAEAWGSELIDYGARGHMVGSDDLGDWEDGRALLTRFLAQA